MTEMTLLQGDCLTTLPTLASASVQCCVTSPPYYGLRDYGVDGQLGLEATPEEYVAKMAEVFREVRRVLRDDGTLWLNIGDTYADESQGHTGLVYRASNWTYVGLSSPTPRWVDPVTGRQVAKKSTKTRSVAEMKALGYINQGSFRKHKYVLHLT